MQSLYKMAFPPPWAIMSPCMLTQSLLSMPFVCLSIRHHALLWLGKKLTLPYKTYANGLLGHRVSSFVLLSISSDPWTKGHVTRLDQLDSSLSSQLDSLDSSLSSPPGI
jgi:hypothetical protein